MNFGATFNFCSDIGPVPLSVLMFIVHPVYPINLHPVKQGFSTGGKFAPWGKFFSKGVNTGIINYSKRFCEL